MLIAKAIKYLDENFKQQPKLVDLAKHLHISEYHLQRIFTEWVGISPKQFLHYLTLGYTKEQLQNAETLATTTYKAGLSSTGRLHDLFVKLEAMTPGMYKKQGEGLEVSYGFFDSPFGEYTLATIQDKICHLAFQTNSRAASLQELKDRWPKAQYTEQQKELTTLSQQIFDFKSTKPLPVLVKGTPFQIKVWEALLRIPEGQVASYQQIATAIGNPKAIRAVGTANGQNWIGYLIPCHRVIRSTGAFNHYRWDALRKKIMIGWEAAKLNNV
ncbi:MAG: methylated-DNA--[protein]-cysteine S-methyltransferase [Aureispira sp.]|nr:methylated-DNA--[protein]-cysteine S-methyltransferase [Aureispira sp.]